MTRLIETLRTGTWQDGLLMAMACAALIVNAICFAVLFDGSAVVL